MQTPRPRKSSLFPAPKPHFPKHNNVISATKPIIASRKNSKKFLNPSPLQKPLKTSPQTHLHKRPAGMQPDPIYCTQIGYNAQVFG
jgi:hypothetical protein